MQVAENGYLFMNMGWYFQYPLFDYLYTGLDRAALARGLSALTGNPDLEPERTLAYELSMRYSFPGNLVASITYFSKQTTNLIDTKTFVPGDSKLVGTYGFCRIRQHAKRRRAWFRTDVFPASAATGLPAKFPTRS